MKKDKHLLAVVFVNRPDFLRHQVCLRFQLIWLLLSLQRLGISLMKVLLANRNRFIFAELRPFKLTLGVPGYLYFRLFLGINLLVDGC